MFNTLHIYTLNSVNHTVTDLIGLDHREKIHHQTEHLEEHEDKNKEFNRLTIKNNLIGNIWTK